MTVAIFSLVFEGFILTGPSVKRSLTLEPFRITMNNSLATTPHDQLKIVWTVFIFVVLIYDC